MNIEDLLGDPEKVAIVAVAVGAILLRVALHYMDKGRIRAAAQRKGWQNVVISWAPFSPGWMLEQNERHYHVTYADADGDAHQVYCKTSLLTGVYWREGMD
ncbi:MAG TPA: hypothetical protein PLO37_15255 [Candidatus Hydrogenedentes bacterium]|nr:hypothetical protein [Candidatus Hydrogenedentota bacterium]HPG68205.1 hypothetical protein [Candidatus Hydrogenedentota bacterium]